MGIFDIFKKKQSSESAPAEQAALPPEQAQPGVPSAVVKIQLHKDLEGLVWIADGKYKNYTAEKPQDFIDVDGVRISFTCSSSWDSEPSLIYMHAPIQKPADIAQVPRPPYFPQFKDLTPEQRWIYAQLLTNPYNDKIDVGYVFILYYGLERHLLSGDFDRAFDVILKLRDVHKNKSFQSYSANALILSAMLRKKGEFIPRFIDSLDKDYEFNFKGDLYLLCLYSFGIPLTPKDLMRFATLFEFENKNYIKKYPEIFEAALAKVMTAKEGSPEMRIEKYITKTELGKIQHEGVRIFANTSLSDSTIGLPLLSSSFKLKKARLS